MHVQNTRQNPMFGDPERTYGGRVESLDCVVTIEPGINFPSLHGDQYVTKGLRRGAARLYLRILEMLL